MNILHGDDQSAANVISSSDITIEAFSVRDLVLKRMNPNDRWRLAIVQRHPCWDEIRMKRLLDSLLAGYPIGSLMLCRLRQGGKELVEKEDTRKAVDAESGSWQLLDGQQRINSLFSIFTEKGRFGRFFLDMTAEREYEDIVTRRRSRRETTSYIVWSEGSEGVSPEFINKREFYIDLSRWYRWAEEKRPEGLRNILTLLNDCQNNCIKYLNEIDPEFSDDLALDKMSVIAKRTERLIRIWLEPSIPVQSLTLDGPMDVLQVFTRINLEGVRLDGESVFFSAVKTLWNDAEENLDRVVKSTSLLNRMTALRLLARLASFADGQNDLQPLRVERLNGPKGKRIIDHMRSLSREGNEVLERIGRLGRMIETESRLGYGLWEVADSPLFDHVFAWAAVCPKAVSVEFLKTELHRIETYLIGATIFRYPTVFRDAFDQLGFSEALFAGMNCRSFPLERILEGCLNRWPELKSGLRKVQNIEKQKDKYDLADKNTNIFLSIAQKLPYEMPNRENGEGEIGKCSIEWDHIYPQALAIKMKVENPKTNRLVAHEYRTFAWSIGNLWALDRPLNNFLRDCLPSQKIELLNHLPDAKNNLPCRWPASEDSSLSREELALLLSAEEKLKLGKINSGMKDFRSFAEGRALRIQGEIFSLYPNLVDFAPDTKTRDGSNYEEPEIKEIASMLGLENQKHEVQKEIGPESEVEKFKAVFSQADKWGVRAELQEIVDVSRRLGLYARPYKEAVMITPPNNKGTMLFTVWTKASERGSFSICISRSMIHKYFRSISEDQALILGPEEWHELRAKEVREFLKNLEDLFNFK